MERERNKLFDGIYQPLPQGHPSEPIFVHLDDSSIRVDDEKDGTNESEPNAEREEIVKREGETKRQKLRPQTM